MPYHYSPRLTKNNFDLLRFLFAATVALCHASSLSGFPELLPITKILSSAIAVKAFFVVSGFLIFMSFERSTSLASYANKRFRRIYPAYFTVVMLCAIGLVVVSAQGPREYFSVSWVKYVAANLAFLNFLQKDLPGVFILNKLSAVNGALWTLKIEAMFYITVPVFVFLFRKFSRLSVLLVTYCLSIVYAWGLSVIAARTGSTFYTELARQLPGQLSYFMSGAFLFYFLPLFERYVKYFLIISVIILVINNYFSLIVLEPFALSCLVIFFGLFLYAGNFGRYGDFSYGIYILHFPIIQLTLHLWQSPANPWFFCVAVMSITLLGAMAMWHLVEKRFLTGSSHYVSATSERVAFK
jgi:peptidoglycan/LPS O-acetylase OafA/YrhL